MCIKWIWLTSTVKYSTFFYKEPRQPDFVSTRSKYFKNVAKIMMLTRNTNRRRISQKIVENRVVYVDEGFFVYWHRLRRNSSSIFKKSPDFLKIDDRLKSPSIFFLDDRLWTRKIKFWSQGQDDRFIV